MSLKLKNPKSITILCLILILNISSCLPFNKNNSEPNPLMRDEKHYPNGTFVGKYAYVDNEGNPVQVKYYADDSSYGVELKSVKVLETSNAKPLLHTTKYDVLGKNIEPFKVPSDLLNINYHILKKESNNPYKYLSKEIRKIKTLKDDKANSDYEVFYQKELRGPKKFSKDNVKIFFDEAKRCV